MTPEAIINITALLISVMSCIVFIWLVATDYHEKDYRLFIVTFVCLVVMMIFAGGYAAIALGITVNTAVLFRPAFSVMAAILTWSMVMVHSTRALKKAGRDALEAASRIEKIKSDLDVMVADGKEP